MVRPTVTGSNIWSWQICNKYREFFFWLIHASLKSLGPLGIKKREKILLLLAKGCTHIAPTDSQLNKFSNSSESLITINYQYFTLNFLHTNQPFALNILTSSQAISKQTKQNPGRIHFYCILIIFHCSKKDWLKDKSEWFMDICHLSP